MLAFWLCGAVIIVGALAAAPTFLRRAQTNHSRSARRRAAWVAFLLLWSAFSLLSTGLVLQFGVPLLFHGSDRAGGGAVMMMIGVGAWVAYGVALARRR